MKIRTISLLIGTCTILALFLADAALLLTTNFRLVWHPEFEILLSATLLMAIARFYSRYRPALRIAHIAETGSFLVLFTNAAAVLNYIMAGILPLPRWDQNFDAIDKAFGLNWLRLYQWVTAHPDIYAGSNIVYASLGPELIFLLLLLEGLGRHSRARELLRNFTTSAIATIVVGILMPAAGPFVFYHLNIAQVTSYVGQEDALRNGSLRLINLADAQGLVAFPSFHTTLAVLCAYSARSVAYAAIPVLVLNILIVFSCLVIGGHYYTDVFGGLLLAAAVITVKSRNAAASENMVRSAG
jgi:membrane-associated phospholipid phosphatase